MTTLVGVLGPAGSGKSMVAEYLVKEYGAVRYSLAGPLKEIAKGVFEFSDEQLYGTQQQKEAVDPRYNFSPRWLLQRLGTEGGRKVFGDDVWIDLLLERVNRDQPALAVCDDVRFINESTKMRQWRSNANEVIWAKSRGVVWRLESPWRDTKADATHQSEAEWPKCPYDLAIAPTQYGTQYLYQLVDDACRHYNIQRRRT